MKPTVPAILALYATAPVFLNATPVYNPASGHYYEAIAASVNWHQAKASAESLSHLGLDGHLVSITSAAESEFLMSTFPFAITGEYWLGGFQSAGAAEPANGWQWVTGEDFYDFVNWGPGEPNNSGEEDYLHFRPDGLWNDIDAFNIPSARGYIVEFEDVPVPENTPTLVFAALSGLSLLGMGFQRGSNRKRMEQSS